MVFQYHKIKFYGFALHSQDTVDIKDLPLKEKILIGLILVGFLPLFPFILFKPQNIAYIFTFIILTLAVEFLLLGLEGRVHFKSKGDWAVKISTGFIYIACVLFFLPLFVTFTTIRFGFNSTIFALIGMFVLFWFVSAIALLYSGSKKIKRDEHKYSEAVDATCVSIEDVNAIVNTSHDGIPLNLATTNINRPIWHYTYNDEEYYVTPSYYNGVKQDEINDKKTLYINPRKPEEIFIPNPSFGKMMMAVGGSFLGIAILLVISILVFSIVAPSLFM